MGADDDERGGARTEELPIARELDTAPRVLGPEEAQIARPDGERLVRAMLADWASTDPWLRRKLDARTVIANVAAIGPTQLIVRTRFEERGMRFVLRSRPRGGEETQPPDPWSIDVALPTDSAPGHEATRSLGTELAMSCLHCDGQGHGACQHCGGTGNQNVGTDTSHQCSACNGDGDARCTTCVGTGAVWGAPTVWARISAREDVRLVDDAATLSLADEVFLDLQDPGRGGAVFHTQRAERLSELRLEGGYRTNASSGRLAQTTRKLLADLDLPVHARIREQVLELRKVPAFALTVDGTSVVVYGDPPIVHPPHALRRRSRAMPMAVAAALLSIAGWVSWLLLR